MNDIVHVAENMRLADVEEISASSGLAPFECLLLSVSISSYSKTIESNGEAIAILGMCSLPDGSGSPWLLGTDLIVKRKKSFLNSAKSAMVEMLGISPALANYVHARNEKSISFLKWLGFSIEGAEPFGVSMEPFHRFSIGGGNV